MSDDAGEEIAEIERRRLAALVAGNIETAAALHADDYELITPGDRVYSKDRYLASVASGEIPYVVFEPASDIRARVHGDTAIVRWRG